MMQMIQLKNKKLVEAKISVYWSAAKLFCFIFFSRSHVSGRVIVVVQHATVYFKLARELVRDWLDL